MGKIIHGLRHSRIYQIYHHMKQRCYYPKNNRYYCYGARGIKVCDEWLNNNNGFVNFYNWAYQNGYDENAERGQCTLDRIDTNGNYEPSNCRWITNKEQCNNRRTNKIIKINGIEKNLKEWLIYYNINNGTYYKRLKKGWSEIQALTTPIDFKKSNKK